ncbi:globin [Chromobacterium haemolyticum]|uniref:Globin n=1 Tax=Chromobacterium fluminis TaxID=3044269 RepID=A0ABX0LE76_9NEIS|nr:globin domain-containing protein [Chromobacterium haemolyticum]NHR07248.1 globin [Chromobacterium haemolyticum]
MVTKKQIQLLQRSWDMLGMQNQEMMERVYLNLFAAHPEYRKLFIKSPHDMSISLVRTFNVVLTSLEDLEQLRPIIFGMGIYHHKFKLSESHFISLRKAILDAMAVQLGDLMTPDIEDAWGMAFDEIAKIMLDGIQSA